MTIKNKIILISTATFVLGGCNGLPPIEKTDSKDFYTPPAFANIPKKDEKINIENITIAKRVKPEDIVMYEKNIWNEPVYIKIKKTENGGFSLKGISSIRPEKISKNEEVIVYSKKTDKFAILFDNNIIQEKKKGVYTYGCSENAMERDKVRGQNTACVSNFVYLKGGYSFSALSPKESIVSLSIAKNKLANLLTKLKIREKVETLLAKKHLYRTEFKKNVQPEIDRCVAVDKEVNKAFSKFKKGISKKMVEVEDESSSLKRLKLNYKDYITLAFKRDKTPKLNCQGNINFYNFYATMSFKKMNGVSVKIKPQNWTKDKKGNLVFSSTNAGIPYITLPKIVIFKKSFNHLEIDDTFFDKNLVVKLDKIYLSKTYPEMVISPKNISDKDMIIDQVYLTIEDKSFIYDKYNLYIKPHTSINNESIIFYDPRNEGRSLKGLSDLRDPDKRVRVSILVNYRLKPKSGDYIIRKLNVSKEYKLIDILRD